MDNFIVKRFDNTKLFLKEFERCLHEQEVVNSFVLTELYNEEDQEDTCIAVLDTRKSSGLIFGFIVTKKAIHISGISPTVEKQQHPSIIDLLVKEYVSTPFPYRVLQGYDPAITLFHEAMISNTDRKFSLHDDAWSYLIEKVNWSKRSLEIKNKEGTFLHQATLDDLNLIVAWTQGYINDDAGEVVVEPGLEQHCIGELTQRNIYILYCDGIPVSMGRRRRLLRHGCALSVVYTSPEHRRNGYGGACVSMITELLLKKFQHVTLFVDAKMDPDNNMYTGVGYKMHTKAARYFPVRN